MTTNINKLVFAGDVINIHIHPFQHILSPHECFIAHHPLPFNMHLSQDACTYLMFLDRPRSMEVAAKLTKALAEKEIGDLSSVGGWQLSANIIIMYHTYDTICW